jgi:hypothetical protein
MERCRQCDAILPLVGVQQSACDEGIHLVLSQLDLDARKPASASLAVPAHALSGRGKWGHTINHRGSPKSHVE